jgi:pimeloyl-ACP methyl ester carboxylesterase
VPALLWQRSRVHDSLFLPGWGAPAGLYRPGLPAGWRVATPPGFDLAEHRVWLERELDSRPGPVVLGGHSMGGALALLTAAARPDLVRRLILISPAGLPLRKPLRASGRDFVRQVVAGRYPRREVAVAVVRVARAPRAALRLARAVHDLDLTGEMRRVRAAAIPVTVVGCTTDTLVTTEHTRRAARLLGAGYRELALAGGHMWMLGAWPVLAAELSTA